ncbi:MAG: ABC transporter ATP-binding protein [Syntrophaceae bacterium]|nr:ABC transporter ATP-binding protein [Syntrophaceae bacterium]
MTLEIENIRFSYGKTPVLRQVSLRAEPGHVVAVLGENGSGKSTLLRAIHRLLVPQGGSVLVEGRAVDRMSPRQIARLMGYLPQKSPEASFTVFDAVLLGRAPHLQWSVSQRDREVVLRVLSLLNLEKEALRNVLELSGGEMQKVFIARALAQEPRVLLLDEPINHLDVKNQIDVMTILRRVTAELAIVSLVVLHDINNALRFADRFLLIKAGEVVAFGGPDVITPANVRTLYNLDVTVARVDGVAVVVPRANGKAAAPIGTGVD